MIKLYKRKHQRGYIALLSVIIVAAILILVVISSNLLSISEARITLPEAKSWEVFYAAEACAERALMNIKDDLDYEGNESLVLDNGSCNIYDVEGLGNENRVIKVDGTVGNQTKRIRIEILQIDPQMDIGSWQEVLAF